MRRGGVLFMVAALAGCGSSYSKLDVDKIKTIAVVVDDPQQTFCAYQPVPLRALVTYRDGKQVQSNIPGEGTKGRLRTTEFAWSANHGAVDGFAVLALPHDALAWYDQPISVSARVATRPTVLGESTLKPRFDCGGTLDVRGAVGARGGESEDAGPGAPGPEVQVALAYVDSVRNGRLVLVRVRSGDQPAEYYLVAPRNAQALVDARAQLVIDARGGAGGRGGQGLTGMPGVRGVDGQPGVDAVACGDGTPGQNGTDGTPGGPGGPGGNGGVGGRGGRVLVQYDARFPELATQVQVLVAGGEPGAAGPAGAGGRGGSGGNGGNGGKGLADAATSCPGNNGADGTRGADGASGPPGPEGQPGTVGPAGERRDAAAEVSVLFADEIARGIPIAAPAAGGGP